MQHLQLHWRDKSRALSGPAGAGLPDRLKGKKHAIAMPGSLLLNVVRCARSGQTKRLALVNAQVLLHGQQVRADSVKRLYHVCSAWLAKRAVNNCLSY